MTRSTNVHEEVIARNVAEMAAQLLSDARDTRTAARAARTIISRRGLRATLIALREGHELAQHDSPGVATLLVIEGSLILRARDREWFLSSHDVIAIPPQRHSLLAQTDAVVLLTVRLD
ncbi:MAG: hypothetical protein ACRDVG_05685 [Jatrophihabitantaceae bacterium]